jgi:hypothetical protein
MPRHSSDGVTAQREPTPRLMFRRKNADGSSTYLHMMDLSQTTSRRDHAWQGNERQAVTVRAKFPHARNLPLVRISR